MDQAAHNKIVSFIWGIADDVLRDLFKRGKYPDVILPMFVLRRLDTVLEATEKQVLETKAMLDQAGITEQHAAVCKASAQSQLTHLRNAVAYLDEQQGAAMGLPQARQEDWTLTVMCGDAADTEEHGTLNRFAKMRQHSSGASTAVSGGDGS